MILLEELLELATKGANRPMVLWLDYFAKKSVELAPELKDILSTLDKDNEAWRKLSAFIALLKQKHPDELEFAKALLYIADIFSDETNDQHASVISEYVRQVMKFYNQAETDALYRRKRDLLKDKMSAEEQMDYDKKLFTHEGMLYCLEYYLAMHKAIGDAPNEKEKQKYIINAEVNMGFGNVPGLWIDFSRDEVLGKFIYSILNDDIRNRLTKAYFDTKEIFTQIRAVCDKQNKCTYDFSLVKLDEVIVVFKKFLEILLAVFVEMGIERLSSFFFTPYGQKPKITEIKL